MWLSLVLMAITVTLFAIAKYGVGNDIPTAEIEHFEGAVDSFGFEMAEAVAAEDSLRRRDNSARKAWNNRKQAQRTVQHVQYARQDYQPERLIFELNTADSIDLVQVYGIGPTFAHRILRYRDRLGGFASKSQLLEIRGMTEEWYERIAPQVTVDPSKVTKINVNEASIDQLKRLPYLDYYLAKAIVNYRKSGVEYCSMQDLAKVNILNDSILRKITPYIEF